MANGLQDFYKTATQYGFARNNLLRLIDIKGTAGDGKPIFPPIGDKNNFGIYLKTASLPSRKLGSIEVNFQSFPFNVPMEATYAENTSFAVTFYCDKYYILRDVFERWSDSLYNEHTLSTTTNFNQCNIQLDLLDNSDPTTSLSEMTVLKKIMLYGCYPNQTGPIAYDTSSNGDIITINATLTFQYMTAESGPFSTN